MLSFGWSLRPARDQYVRSHETIQNLQHVVLGQPTGKDDLKFRSLFVRQDAED